MYTSSSSQAFFSGRNPYTGAPIERSRYEAEPEPPPPPPKTNPDEVLDPLYSAQQSLSYAKSSLNQIRSCWNSVSREAGSAESSATRAQTNLYPAESDTEEVDNSSAGRYTNSELDGIERTLWSLQSNSNRPDSAIYEVRTRVNEALGYLNRVDSGRLPYPWRHQQVLRSLADFQSTLYRIENTQSQLDTKLGSSKDALQRSRYDVNTVANDREGQNVSYPARNAQSNLRTLQQELRGVGQHLSWNESDLSSAESLLSTAESDVGTVRSEFDYAWHTSDGRQ